MSQVPQWALDFVPKIDQHFQKFFPRIYTIDLMYADDRPYLVELNSRRVYHFANGRITTNCIAISLEPLASAIADKYEFNAVGYESQFVLVSPRLTPDRVLVRYERHDELWHGGYNESFTVTVLATSESSTRSADHHTGTDQSHSTGTSTGWRLPVTIR